MAPDAPFGVHERKTQMEESVNTKVEVLESGETKLTVTIDADDIKRRIAKKYKDFGNQYRFPGFRKGHVPRPVIDANLGREAVRNEVTNDLLNETYPIAIDEADLCYFGEPSFGEVSEFVVEGQDFTYDMTLSVKPVFELSSYDPVSIEIPFKEATEKEIDDQLEALRQGYYDYEDAADDAAIEEGGSLDMTMKVMNEAGEELTTLAAEKRLYELGRGLYPKALDDALIGKKKGDHVSLTLEVAENPCMMSRLIEKNAKQATFEVDVDCVKTKVVPEVTDEWVSGHFGMSDVPELRGALKIEIDKQKSQVIPRILETNALFELGGRLEGEAPEGMIAEATDDLYRTFWDSLQRNGVTFDQYLANNGLTVDAFREDVKKQAKDTVVQNLALDAYARHAGISVTDDEVRDEFKNSGQEDFEAMYADFKKHGRLHIVREGILRGKALEEIVNGAKVTEVEEPSAPAADPAAPKEEKKPAAKKTTTTTRKTASKKTGASSAKKDEAPADAAEEKKPAAKKAPAKKASAAKKPAAAAKAPAKKPAAKKTAAKKDEAEAPAAE